MNTDTTLKRNPDRDICCGCGQFVSAYQGFAERKSDLGFFGLNQHAMVARHRGCRFVDYGQYPEAARPFNAAAARDEAAVLRIENWFAMLDHPYKNAWHAGWRASQHRQPFDPHEAPGWRDGWQVHDDQSASHIAWATAHPAEAEDRERKRLEGNTRGGFDPAYGYTEAEFFGGENS